MKTITTIAACGLAALLGIFAAPGAAAQNAALTPENVYAALDTWFRADEYNARCRQLNYFEVEEIARRINDVKDLTPEGKDMRAAIGQPGFEAKLDIVREMLETRRVAAREAVAGRACNASDADLADARGTYLRTFLKALLAAQNSPAKAADSQARRTAADKLMSFIATLYGTNYNSVGQQVIAELQAEGFDPDTAWRALEVPLDDSIWQLNMKNKGFDYHPYFGALGYYKAVRVSGNEGDFPAKLSKRTLINVRDEAGAKLKVSKADGLMDDGRLVVLVNKQGKYPGLALQAELLVQESAEEDTWSDTDWRSGTLRFTPEVMDTADCPVDFCFVFPLEAAEAIRTRQASDDSFKYRYELYIGEDAMFPLSDSALPFRRNEYYPPYPVEAGEGSDGGE